jgi:hypothetical protein
MGYSSHALGVSARAYYAAAGFFLLLPAEAFAGARWCNLAGALMAIALFFWERRARSARGVLRA